MQLTMFVNNTFYYSQDACCGILTWRNLKGLAESANLTVWTQRGVLFGHLVQ